MIRYEKIILKIKTHLLTYLLYKISIMKNAFTAALLIFITIAFVKCTLDVSSVLFTICFHENPKLPIF